MKPIERSKLKVGDWISTSPIFNAVNKDNKIIGCRKVAEVMRIDNNGITNGITIKCWGIHGEEIMDKRMIDKGEEISLLGDDEIIDIKKKLILHNLE